MIKRILYLGYYIKQLEKDKFSKFVNHVTKLTEISKLRLYSDMLLSSVKYNISLIEYFLFRFYELSSEERATFAGTGFMYEYQLKMNPKSKRRVLSDKLQFLNVYRDYVLHKYVSLKDLSNNPKLTQQILENPSGKVVLKSADGQCGRGIEVRIASDFTPESLIARLKETENDFVEEFVVQHPNLNSLSPSGLNTVRVITQINKNHGVEIIAARLRISINSAIDNMAAGNAAAFVNPVTGIVEGAAVYSDITKSQIEVHPLTGIRIIGFQVPFWEETLEMVRSAALLDISNRSIGWDVAITLQGPELIEGNHDWCKLLWQLPAKRGLKNDLTAHL